MQLRIILLLLVVAVVSAEGETHEQVLKNAGMHKVLMSTNWKDIVDHVNKHWQGMDTSELNTQNKLLEGALNMGLDYFGDARKLQVLAHDLNRFVSTHSSTMPSSTLHILSDKATKLHHLAVNLDRAKRTDHDQQL